MSGKLGTLERRLFMRRCVACGYDGALLRGGEAERCARCGCDLLARPARSYAEMEGFVTQRPQRPWGPQPQDRLLPRWLAFLFIAAVCVTTLGYLATAVLAM
jgi:hypothetical protein